MLNLDVATELLFQSPFYLLICFVYLLLVARETSALSGDSVFAHVFLYLFKVADKISICCRKALFNKNVTMQFQFSFHVHLFAITEASRFVANINLLAALSTVGKLKNKSAKFVLLSLSAGPSGFVSILVM